MSSGPGHLRRALLWVWVSFPCAGSHAVGSGSSPSTGAESQVSCEKQSDAPNGVGGAGTRQDPCATSQRLLAAADNVREVSYGQKQPPDSCAKPQAHTLSLRVLSLPQARQLLKMKARREVTLPLSQDSQETYLSLPIGGQLSPFLSRMHKATKSSRNWKRCWALA